MNNKYRSISSYEACTVYGGQTAKGKKIAYEIGRFLGELGKALGQLISGILGDSSSKKKKETGK